MTIEDLKAATTECDRFLARVAELQTEYEAQVKRSEAINAGVPQDDFARRAYFGLTYHPRETGAVRRASMDLTRALAKLRRYGE